MTEVEPIVKPMPKREAPSKPRPKKNDPWTVPAPKVNPTPKANLIDMTDNKNKKILVDSKNKFEILKKMMTKERFYDKFVVSMKVVSEVIAEEAMTNLYFEDSRMLTTEEMKALRKSGKF